MKAAFVTATGTDVGKTFISAGLIRARIRAGGKARAIKPVMSGYDPVHPGRSDAGLLLAAMGRAINPDTVAAISPWRFTAAISPDMAAAREGVGIPFHDVLGFCRTAVSQAPGMMLVEGAGGVMVPLDAEHTMRDLIVLLGLPALLVTGSYLGTISHTLTAAETLRDHGVRLAAIVLSESETSPVPVEETAACIRRFLPETPVHGVHRDPDDEAFSSLARSFEQF